jgi:hypothetical protein
VDVWVVEEIPPVAVFFRGILMDTEQEKKLLVEGSELECKNMHTARVNFQRLQQLRLEYGRVALTFDEMVIAETIYVMRQKIQATV